MYDLRRIRYVTEHYEDLKGLTLVPLALWLLGSAAQDVGWLSTPGWLSNTLILAWVSVLVVLALMYLIGRLYERAYGSVAPDEVRRVEFDERAFMAYWLAVSLTFLAVDLLPSLSQMGMAVCITLLWVWWIRRRDKHVLTLAIVVAVMTLAPLLEGLLGPVYPSVTARDIAIKLVTATGILLVATRDHLMLVRTLGPIRHEEESRA